MALSGVTGSYGGGGAPVLRTKTSPLASGATAASGSTAARGSGAATATGTGANGKALSPSQQKLVDQLKQRDQEVRTHEAAHMSAGGQYASAASYTYQKGPDGANYAIGGEVQIDSSPVPNNPSATIAKMLQVEHAALAPAQPSGQDEKVAQQAAQAAAQAQAEQAAGGGAAGAAKGAKQNGTQDQNQNQAQGQSQTGSPTPRNQGNIQQITATAATAQNGGSGGLLGLATSSLAAYGAAAALGAGSGRGSLLAVVA